MAHAHHRQPPRLYSWTVLPPVAIAAGLARERAALVRILGAPGVAERCGRVGSAGGGD